MLPPGLLVELRRYIWPPQSWEVQETAAASRPCIRSHSYTCSSVRAINEKKFQGFSKFRGTISITRSVFLNLKLPGVFLAAISYIVTKFLYLLVTWSRILTNLMNCNFFTVERTRGSEYPSQYMIQWDWWIAILLFCFEFKTRSKRKSCWNTLSKRLWNKTKNKTAWIS
jgi:hypothetical protein